MDIKQITALGVAEDIAVKIAELSGAELKAETDRTAALTKELEASKATVKEITEKLRAYDGVDVEGLKAKAVEWEKRYNDDMTALKFDHALDGALTAAKAKNLKAVKGLLDVGKLQLTKAGNIDGLDEQLAALKKSDGYMFESDDEEKSPRIAGQTKGGGSASSDEALRAAFGLSAKKD